MNRVTQTMGRVLALGCVVLLVASCGGDASPQAAPRSSVLVPWMAALSAQCSQPAGLQGLRATLRVGGDYPDCPLTVDAVTLTASGSCGSYLVGLPRPLALVYDLDAGDPSVVATVAMVVGFVDLSRGSLSAGQTEVAVHLGDPATSLFVTSPAELAALATPSSELDARLRDAAMWAEQNTQERAQPDDFDIDEDGCRNLVEACSGTLGDSSTVACP